LEALLHLEKITKVFDRLIADDHTSLNGENGLIALRLAVFVTKVPGLAANASSLLIGSVESPFMRPG
jgi:hypothetical protein